MTMTYLEGGRGSREEKVNEASLSLVHPFHCQKSFCRVFTYVNLLQLVIVISMSFYAVFHMHAVFTAPFPRIFGSRKMRFDNNAMTPGMKYE
jgi:hypothetical protein